MEEKINIAAILKDKSQGTKLYDWLHNIDIELDTISTTDTETVVWCTNETNNNTTCHRGYSEFGTERGYPDGLQIIFPSKEMRDWRKFLWKKGDVLVCIDGKCKVIFDKFDDDKYTSFIGKHYIESYGKDGEQQDYEEIHCGSTVKYTKESEEAAQTYIKTIEERLGGKLNRETLEIENVKKEFKDGDILFVKCKSGAFIEIFNYFKNNGDLCDHASLETTLHELDISGEYKIFKENIIEIRLATEEEKQQLFDALAKKGKVWDAEKKKVVDIKKEHQFKPFEKVLVRDSYENKWRASFFSHIKEGYAKYVTTGFVWKFCIPYEGNEHLLGTTNNVEDQV